MLNTDIKTTFSYNKTFSVTPYFTCYVGPVEGILDLSHPRHGKIRYVYWPLQEFVLSKMHVIIEKFLAAFN